MSLSKHCSQMSTKPPNRVGIDISFLIIGKEDKKMTEIKKAVEMERVLRLQKDGNKIEVKGHLTNDECTKLIKILIKDGWKAENRII